VADSSPSALLLPTERGISSCWDTWLKTAWIRRRASAKMHSLTARLQGHTSFRAWASWRRAVFVRRLVKRLSHRSRVVRLDGALEGWRRHAAQASRARQAVLRARRLAAALGHKQCSSALRGALYWWRAATVRLARFAGAAAVCSRRAAARFVSVCTQSDASLSSEFQIASFASASPQCNRQPMLVGPRARALAMHSHLNPPPSTLHPPPSTLNLCAAAFRV